ncbi:hypothetical protein LLG95_11035 [bacterium]|nr:hypothetical protein [bacterium]
MKWHIPSVQHFFLHDYFDNLVYRAEIRMNWKGRLRWSSPVMQAHWLMFMTIGASAGAWRFYGFTGMAAMSFGVMAAVSLLGYFIAFYLGYHSIWRERVAGSLEQLCLTLLSDEDLLNGKFYGVITPFKEARRYLYLHCIAVVAVVGWLTRDPFPTLGSAIALTMMFNHMNFSYFIGALAGLHAAQLKHKSMLASIILEREYIVILPEVGVLVRTFLMFAVLFIAAVFVGWIVLRHHVWVMLIPALVFPIHMYTELQNIQALQHEKLKRYFKKNIVFE